MSSARQRAARASSHPAKGLSRLQPSPRAPAGATGRGSQPGRSPPGSHCAGAWSTQMTPRHGKPLAGRQEILILHPKSFPKQRNGLPGQRAEILTAKLKKPTRGETVPRSKGAWEGTSEPMQGGCLGFLSPGKVVAARMSAGRGLGLWEVSSQNCCFSTL